MKANGVKLLSEEKPLTKSQAKEIIKCRNDVEYFIKNYVSIQHPTLGAMLFDLYDYQSDVIQGLIKYDKNIILQPRQSGKALSLDTKIPTPDGWTTMEEINVGDIIIDADGNPTKVIFHTETMYNHDCYKITFDNNETIIADEDHLWEVQHPDWHNKGVIQKKLKNTKEIKKKLYNRSLKSARPFISINKPLKLSKRKLPIDPYTLGVWLGDGHSYSATIYGLKPDLENINNYISKSFEILPLRYNNGNCCSQTIKGLHCLLKENNLMKNKHIPVDYLRASKKQRIDLLRGLMDTDGSCDKKGANEFYQKNKNLINQVKELLSSLGIKCNERNKIINEETYYTLSFCTRKFYVYNLKRKRERQKLCKNHQKNTRIYFKSIEKIDSVPVRCIKVDNKDHLFLCGETMIPTHNTITIVAYLLHQAIFTPNITIGVAAHKGTGAKEIISRFRYAYENLPMWIKPSVESYNVFDVIFSNGSKILSQTTTESTYRGMSLSILYLDEFAFVKPSIETEFWKSILPTLSAPGTKVVLTSTPNTSEGKYADVWFKAERGENEYNPIRVYNEQVPGREDGSFKKSMLMDMSPIEYAQEFDCAFVSNKGTLIQSELLESLRPSEPISEHNGLRLFGSIKGKRIGLAIDVGTGTGQDYSVIQVFNLDTFEQLAEFNDNTLNLTEFTKQIIKILKYIDAQGATEIYYTVESNSIGQGVIQLLHNSEIPILKKADFISGIKKKQLGILTTTKSKMHGCTKFKDLVEGGGMKLHSKLLLSELKFFVKSGTSFAAESGKNDDLVMGCVLFCLMVDEIGKYDADVYDKLNDSSIIGLMDDDDESNPLPFVF